MRPAVFAPRKCPVEKEKEKSLWALEPLFITRCAIQNMTHTYTRAYKEKTKQKRCGLAIQDQEDVAREVWAMTSRNLE